MIETQKTVLVTGASSGIGRATAMCLAADGHHVVVTGRRPDRLADVVAGISSVGGSAQALPLDVTDRSNFRDVVDTIGQERGSLDVLVNNAGVMLLSRLAALAVDEWNHMIEVNLVGLMNGAAAALPQFRRQGGGHFITVASIGAHQVSPTSAVYSASKYAAWAFTEGLRQESEPTIRVTTISPGVVESELAEHISDPDARELMRQYRRHSIAPEAIARGIAFAMDQPPDVDVNEIIMRPTRQR